MRFLDGAKERLLGGIRRLFGRRAPSHLADRLLADAFRFGEIPSHGPPEEKRVRFVTERLAALGVPYTAGRDGSVTAFLRGERPGAPLLLFTGLGWDSWHPGESLGRLDRHHAHGAGLAGALGPAALLSLAENHASLFPSCTLFFMASPFESPARDAFDAFAAPELRPRAALGVRGFLLGSIYRPVSGRCRVEVRFARPPAPKRGGWFLRKAAGGNAGGSKADVSGALLRLIAAVNAMNEGAADGSPAGLFVGAGRIVAHSHRSRFPVEGLVELVLESAAGEKLDAALAAIRAEVDACATKDLAASFNLISHIPPAPAALSAGVAAKVRSAMEALAIRPLEKTGADPSALLAAMGIPAVSIGLVEGADDRVAIASVERGRRLLERCAALLAGAEDAP